jgi:hypothetical protein
MSAQIFVTNLAYSVTNETLHQLFSRYVDVHSVKPRVS